MPIDDEMPQAPGATQTTTGATGGSPEVAFDGTFDASDFEGVPGLENVLPAGVYEVRLKSYSQKKNDKGPFFGLQWAVQQEPLVGRMIFENYVPWVDEATLIAARAGDPVAKGVMSDRLPRIKAIMKAAEYKPVGKTDIVAFLATNPELKVQVTVSERKEKDPNTRQYVGTGEMENRIVKYISKMAPR